VGIKANRRWMDQFEDRIGTHRDAREVEGGDFFTESCLGKTENYTDVGMGKLGSILRVCLLVVAALTGIMIGSYRRILVTEEVRRRRFELAI
jgi:hypothetical protein